MTAALFRRNAVPAAGSAPDWSIGSEAPDRRLLTTAAGVAIAIHLAAMLLPLPTGHVLPTALIVVGDPPMISPTRLKPPAPPEVREIPRDLIPQKRRFPVPEAPANEPLREPTVLTFAVDPSIVPAVEPVLGNVSAPHALPSVYPEWKPGLALPVALPGRVKPEYPPIGRALGADGVVILRAVITTEGRVESIRVLRSPIPDPGFTEEAIEAVSQWRYEPGLLGERPVAVELTVRVEFTLNR